MRFCVVRDEKVWFTIGGDLLFVAANTKKHSNATNTPMSKQID